MQLRPQLYLFVKNNLLLRTILFAVYGELENASKILKRQLILSNCSFHLSSCDMVTALESDRLHAKMNL